MDRNESIKEILKKYTEKYTESPAIARETLISEGIYAEDGELAPEYGGPVRKKGMKIQSRHSDADRGLDAYFSPPEAVYSLLEIEKEYFPDGTIWEPAAGAGAIVKPFQQAGFTVYASDINGSNYGLDYCDQADYLKVKDYHDLNYLNVKAIITNPPYKLATQFVEKAVTEVPYVALLLRTNFLESTSRLPFFRKHKPARIWISSRRLPMMHRHGWDGPLSTSNTCFAWFIWDQNTNQKGIVDWFDYKEIMEGSI